MKVNRQLQLSQQQQPKTQLQMADPLDTSKFWPGQLVFCRYHTYPYWTGRIQNAPTKVILPPEAEERHRAKFVDKEGTFWFYWCVFFHDQTDGWVREDRVVLYHPTLTRFLIVPPATEFYEGQKAAFKEALKGYQELYAETPPPTASDPTEDILEVYLRGGDPLNDI